MPTEEHIANYNGHLLVDLNGPISSIPADSSVPVPSNFEVQAAFSLSSDTCGSPLTWEWLYPDSCYYFDFAGPALPFLSAQNVANPGYQITIYSTSNCTGTPLATISPSDTTCHSFSQAVGVSVLPLWNWD